MMTRYSKTLTPEAAGVFIAAVRGGATIEDAAAAAGVAMSTLYCRRERDPAFAATWDEAAAISAGPELAWVPARGRYQLRRGRRIRFTRDRKQIFLDHFAGGCDLAAAAEAAGVSADSVYKHLRRDHAFAAAFEEALALGYVLLEAEAVRQGRAMQEAYRIQPNADAAAQAKSFDQCLQLLRQWKRRDGTLGPRAQPLDKWNFEDAFAALEKELTVFGLRLERGEAWDDDEEDDLPDDPPAALPAPDRAGRSPGAGQA
jgi:hypothetical protein